MWFFADFIDYFSIKVSIIYDVAMCVCAKKLGMMDVLCLCMCKKKEDDDDDEKQSTVVIVDDALVLVCEYVQNGRVL
jgi:hypothetical protein